MLSDYSNLSEKIKQTKNLIAVYDQNLDGFSYSDALANYFPVALNGEKLWDFLVQNGITSVNEADEIQTVTKVLNAENASYFGEYVFGGHCKHIFAFVYADGKVTISIKKVKEDCGDTESRDEITGLLSRNDFCSQINGVISANPRAKYSVFFFDIIKFKAINDIFGFKEGDKLLAFIGEMLRGEKFSIALACRESADRFAFLADVTKTDENRLIGAIIDEIKGYELPFEIYLNVGVYKIQRPEETGHTMLDKAMLAQSVIKGSYTSSVNFFTDNLRDEMLSEQEITGSMSLALSEEQFLVYYQPQYNHSTGMIIGAEALVRWEHPTKGLISPARFIPIFEKNGFITKLDFYVFDKVAKFIKRSMDKNFSIVPISINFSKNDIFFPNFVENLEIIRNKHGVPAKYLRIELTESILIGNNKAVNDILRKLHAVGYVVEMDDFGSGYSSLNVLKDLEFDVIKLDMLFLENKDESGRGGTILSSVINMAKWLGIPVIAEGVETVSQADFLKSIGCDNIQGYLYSKPLPEKEYEKLISASSIGALMPQMKLAEKLNAANFWDPTSQETLIFSNFVGAAVIFSYDRAKREIEILRVNKKYLRELGMNLSEKEIIHGNPDDTLDEFDKKVYYETLDKAIETGEEQECETWRNIKSACCGEDRFCIRSQVTVIGQSDNEFLFYGMIRNITVEKNVLSSFEDTERNFKAASEQANIYFWEYTIATKEMKPCFRCMRDLGFPPLLRNYPEPAIEGGVFPPEFADEYRDWHVQMANGAAGFEAVVPLTPDRIPFRVKYTTEFDENGHAIKAYGSATLIVND